jgi:hypothetical protein
MSGVSSRTRASIRRAVGGLAILGVAVALTACGSSGTPASSSSSSRAGVVTTAAGGDSCQGRTAPNEASPDFYRQQYSTQLVKQLKERLGAYDSAVDSADPQHIGDAASALSIEVRADARLVSIPRLFGCYDQKVLSGLLDATEAFGSTLDVLPCAGTNTCNRKQTEVPGLVARARPQERTYVVAINAYAAQFGGEQLPLPQTPPT